MFSKKRSYKIFFATKNLVVRKHFGSLSLGGRLRMPKLRVSSDGKILVHDNEPKKLKLYSSFERHSSTSADNIVKSKYESISTQNLNLPQYVWKNVDQWSDKTMITCGQTGHSYTYGQGYTACTSFANALISDLQLKKGDVIGLLLPNTPEFVISIYGALKAGVIVTFINPLYTPDEIQRQFDNAEVKYCVTIPELVNNLEKAATSLKNYKGTIVVNTNKSNISSSNLKVYDFDELLSSNEGKTVSLPEFGHKDVAILPYSSGTTGLPKGVMLTHENCVANLVQIEDPDLTKHGLTTDTFQERSLTVLPFFHIYGFNSILNVALEKGLHTITMPKFVPDTYIKCLKDYKPTLLFVVPSLLLFLTSHPSVKPEYLASVREIVSGAAPATKSLIDNFKNKFNHPGLTIRQGYGMTELSPCALLTPLNSRLTKDGSAGVLVRDTQARIVSLTDGSNQPAHKSGELYIKGPQMMKGYWKNDKATKETIDDEGWLHTGDVAYYDDDEFFFIIDRTKELIKVKGNQVSPTELESLIMKLPEVADVAVVGIPDPLADEIPKAFIVLKPNKTLTAEEITKFINSQVVNYKKLAGGVEFIDSIPRNAAGKILRKELKILGAKAS